MLTRLGVLLIGTAADRRQLGVVPIVQAIKYDELGQKINKWLWNDGERSPLELVDAIWREVPDFRESYEVPDGMTRRNVPAYDEKVVRELLVNAFVHRPYTQQGDLFLSLHPDRLEVVNPGRLPVGVTPHNMLHASRRRNENLAHIFHDLGMMEGEGSGIDLIYDRLLSQGRPAPVMEEGVDWVRVTVRREMKPAVMELVELADKRYKLTQRERIVLGALGRKERTTARELVRLLELQGAGELRSWFGRLPELKLIVCEGATNGMQYGVAFDGLSSSSGAPAAIRIGRLKPKQVLELIRQDIERHPNAQIRDVEGRLGSVVTRSQVKRGLAKLVAQDLVTLSGERRSARYRIAGS
jgi:ATP-dependent DNA helicase RecG